MSKKTLMVVDNSATMRQIILRTIGFSGVEFDLIKEADSGQNALERLERHPIVDIVLCDVRMPGMSGLELLKAIRQNSTLKGIQVVLVGQDSLDNESDFISVGADGYISKPFTPEEFQRVLEPLVK